MGTGTSLGLGRKLIDGLRYPTVVRDAAALRAFDIRPIGAAQAMADALRNEDEETAATRWTDALSSWRAAAPYGGVRFGNRLVDMRSASSPLDPGRVFAAVQRIGGRRGWYHAGALWRIRGAIDLLAGGPGMRRGRRDPDRLRAGETLDCWRVEDIDPPRRLRLLAEMKLPGRAWLQFDVEPQGGGSRLTQTAIFDPLGLAGLLYWYGIYPVHAWVFRGMLAGILRAAGNLPDSDRFAGRCP